MGICLTLKGRKTTTPGRIVVTTRSLLPASASADVMLNPTIGFAFAVLVCAACSASSPAADFGPRDLGRLAVAVVTETSADRGIGQVVSYGADGAVRWRLDLSTSGDAFAAPPLVDTSGTVALPLAVRYP